MISVKSDGLLASEVANVANFVYILKVINVKLC